MSDVTPPQSVPRRRVRRNDRVTPIALVLGATLLALLMNAGLVTGTLRGQIADPDDAMRLVEVRAWLGGQAWFDMNAMRLDPPQGSFMHWSRLVDLPAAALIKLFESGTPQASAERLASVALPTLWLVALFLGMARLATCLVGAAGRLPVLLGTLLSGATLVQFGPGRIGHHAPETVCLVFAVGAAVAALDPRRAREALACGALCALSLAMSLETLPFLVILAATLFGFWIWRGSIFAPMLGWFGAGLVVALPLLFLLTVEPERWTAPVCDAFSAAHLGAWVIGGIGALALAALTTHLRAWLTRLVSAGSVAVLALAYVAWAYPACLHSPFAGIDPLVRELWLRHVVESLPLPAFLASRPMVGLAIVAPLVLGLAGSVVATFMSHGTQRLRFVPVTILAAAGLALAFWQVRVLGSVTPIALCGGVFLAVSLQERLAAQGLAIAAACAPAAILAFASTVWLLALPEDNRSAAAVKASEAKAACLAPQAFGPLATLPSGTVVAPMDSGAHLLEATRLSVFAAPYHRNDDGNRFAFDVFLAAPDAASALLTARNVTYVLTCPGMSEMDRLATRAPAGLAARLASGAIPAFLKRLPLPGTPYEVYAVTPGVR